MTDDGFVVYKGGKCNIEETPSLKQFRRDLRARLIHDGILKEEHDVLVFQSDHIFSSSSAAATTILGRSSNGWTSWKNKV